MTILHRHRPRTAPATPRRVVEDIAAGTFRDDFYYRINIFPIHVPALRERRDDIPALAMHFLKVFGEELGKKVTEISEGARGASFFRSTDPCLKPLDCVM